ncbi:Hint domain-containing protein [Roseovarius sp. SCSIO 43702]|uniref:Hint domain-containing protein n=1 Tax=Roseovarius sp. SCSIO 43702 TaxID=2823043 RepID=UPI001C733104|nr:Hint domain-containing protein [Roseovarius sp. SCSIO 43702]QYX55416.1 Hint domain-containing protein [Roseovarius sp. SCSIO 43702]
MTDPGPSLTQTLPVYRAAVFNVVAGANLGDPISFAAELDLDDTYELRAGATPVRLTLETRPDGGFLVASGSRVGVPGNRLCLDACLTFMSSQGATTEIIVMVEVDAAGDVEQVFALPLAPLEAKIDYTLVGIDRDSARTKFAQVACVSFTRGTRITMASGAQTPIEALREGVRVLTRDDGPQTVRWIGASTMRATGSFAPIRIRAGALNNTGDLLVSPDHRLFIYQRSDALGAGRNEILVRARHLVNGTTIVQEDGGFVDYFQILFDEHQIIYAEGIAAETLLVDTRTRAALPPDLDEALSRRIPGHAPRPHHEFEVSEALLDHPDAAEMLRRASTR